MPPSPSRMPERWQAGRDSPPRISCCGDASSSYLMLPEVPPCPKHWAQLLGTKGRRWYLPACRNPLVGQKPPRYAGVER